MQRKTHLLACGMKSRFKYIKCQVTQKHMRLKLQCSHLKIRHKWGRIFTGWTEIGNKDTGIAESTEPKTSFQIVKGQYGDRIFTANWTISSWKDMSGDDSDDDKISQKRDTNESKANRNKVNIA